MNYAEDLADVRAKLENHQRQLVEMRAALVAMEERAVSVMEHTAKKEVEAIVGTLPTPDEVAHLKLLPRAFLKAEQRKSELLMHVLKWGVGGALAFSLLAFWEGMKAKLGLAKTP